MSVFAATDCRRRHQLLQVISMPLPNDDPKQIAAWLVQQHGLERARMEVLAGVMQAQKAEDNYALSVWRDVKRILGQASSEDQHAA